MIDRFSASGIHVLGEGGNVIAGDIIGTDVAGDPGLGNGFDGILIDQSPGNMIGGSSNVIASNKLVGVRITGAASSGNVVLGNLIGTDPTGARPGQRLRRRLHRRRGEQHHRQRRGG